MTIDIDALKRKVLARYPFFGSVAAGVQFEETEKVRTTANDGKTIYYAPSYLSKLTMGEQIFVISHELCHIAFRHIQRSRGREPLLWKKATDAVVNQLLKRDGLKMAEGSIDDPEAIEYDAERYYEILLEEKLAIELIEGKMSAGQGGQRDGSSDPSEPDGYDGDHSMWENAVSQEQEEDEEHEEDLLEELERIRQLAGDMAMPDLPADQDEPEDLPGQEGPEGREESEEEQEEQYSIAARKVSRAGNENRPDTRRPQGCGTAAPILDWRLLLRDSIHYGVDWSFTNAVVEDGIVRPALEERPMPETEIVLDTSWSVDDELLRNFLRECKNILPLSKVKAGCFDTVFYGFQEIRTEDDIENMMFEGGGGTDFNAAVNAFTLRVDNRIIFTDGEASMPDTPLNAIWMVYGDQTIAPEGGTVIQITGEQLQRLRGR